MPTPTAASAPAADGAAIAADVTGRPDGPTALLLPGQSLGPEVLDALATDLAPHARVVVVHTRGTGRSAATGEGWSTRTFAADALAVLDGLGVRRAHVVGFSMGGRVAQVLAAEHPGRIGRLVLGATGPGGAHEVAREAGVSAAMRRLATPAGRAALAELFFTPTWIAANPQRAARFAPQGPPRVQRLHHAASTGHDGWELLPRITAPTLVLHGAEDRMTPPANAELLARRVPGARLELLPGARHGYLEEARPLASRLVVEFLAGGSSRR